MILREFSDRNNLKIYELTIDLYDIYSFIVSLIITLIFYGTFYLIQNE